MTFEECDHFIAVAEAKGLEDSVTQRLGGSKQNKLYLRDINQDKRLSINEVIYNTNTFCAEKKFCIHPKDKLHNVLKIKQIFINNSLFIQIKACLTILAIP